MFATLLLVASQAASPAPPLQRAEVESLGVRLMISRGGIRMLVALARTRDVPLDDVFIADADLTERASAIARVAGLRQGIAVYLVPAWTDLMVVNVESFRNDERIEIFVSPLLLEYQDAPGRDGMLAHELAHMVEPCGPNYASDAETAACEHAVDLRASRWVGTQASIRGLCQLMAGSWYWRYSTDASHLIERIRRLHDTRAQ